MNIGFTLEDIKKLTVLQVNLFMQRHNEPVYKQQVDDKIREQMEKSKGKSRGR